MILNPRFLARAARGLRRRGSVVTVETPTGEAWTVLARIEPGGERDGVPLFEGVFDVTARRAGGQATALELRAFPLLGPPGHTVRWAGRRRAVMRVETHRGEGGAIVQQEAFLDALEPDATLRLERCAYGRPPEVMEAPVHVLEAAWDATAEPVITPRAVVLLSRLDAPAFVPTIGDAAALRPGLEPDLPVDPALEGRVLMVRALPGVYRVEVG